MVPSRDVVVVLVWMGRPTAGFDSGAGGPDLSGFIPRICMRLAQEQDSKYAYK